MGGLGGGSEEDEDEDELGSLLSGDDDDDDDSEVSDDRIELRMIRKEAEGLAGGLGDHDGSGLSEAPERIAVACGYGKRHGKRRSARSRTATRWHSRSPWRRRRRRCCCARHSGRGRRRAGGGGRARPWWPGQRSGSQA